MPFFAAGFADMVTQLIVLMLFLLAPLIKGVVEYLAEQKKKQEAKKEKPQNLREVYGIALAEQESMRQENEKVMLAEELEIAYDDLVILDDVPAKSKKSPKIRSKSNRKKAVETELPPVSVAQPVLVAAAESTRIEPVLPSSTTSGPKPSPLAVEILKMFQSPTGVQQAVLASEILKRRF